MIQFGADFSVSGVPETGLFPTITIRDTADGSIVVSAAAMTEVGGGAYKYDFSNDTAKKYSVVSDGGVDTLDSRYLTAWSERAKAEAEIVDILADTNELQTDDIPGTLATIDALIDRILNATEIRQAAVVGAGATTTKFISNLTEVTNDFWNRMAILFTSGQNDGQMRRVKDYVGGTKEITMQTPLSFVPADADTFIICTVRAFITPDIEDIVDQIWDETQADHVAGGSFGEIATEIAAIPTTAMRGTDGANTTVPDVAGTAPTVSEIQAEMEENGASLLDTIKDIVSHGTYGNSALQVLVAALQTDLDNGTDGLGALKALIDIILIDTNELQLNQGNWLTATGFSIHNVADIIAGIADGSYDLQEMIRIIFAVCAGKSSGGGTVNLKFRNSGDTKNRVVATADSLGNRTTVILDGS